MRDGPADRKGKCNRIVAQDDGEDTMPVMAFSNITMYQWGCRAEAEFVVLDPGNGFSLCGLNISCVRSVMEFTGYIRWVFLEARGGPDLKVKWF